MYKLYYYYKTCNLHFNNRIQDKWKKQRLWIEAHKIQTDNYLFKPTQNVTVIIVCSCYCVGAEPKRGEVTKRPRLPCPTPHMTRCMFQKLSSGWVCLCVRLWSSACKSVHVCAMFPPLGRFKAYCTECTEWKPKQEIQTLWRSLKHYHSRAVSDQIKICEEN